MSSSANHTLRKLFDAAVAACHPARVVGPALPARPDGRIVVVGAGKAAAAMAAEVERVWGGALSGLVVTRYEHTVPTQHIEVIEAGHPYPDDASADAAARTLSLVRGLSADDFVLVLLSGGGSALWGAPLAPITLAQKREVTRQLILSQASIGEINCVRKHLSAIKGGRFAAAAFPARVLTLAISDVPGDALPVIASGPTCADPTTQADALEILHRYGIAISDVISAVLSNPAHESLKFGDPRLARSDHTIVARAGDALAAASDAAHRLGFDVRLLGVHLEGDARSVGLAHAEIALHAHDVTRPLVLLSGGELTLPVAGTGFGGPNREYLMAFARRLAGSHRITALACDTDGIDGNDHVAGGWIDGESVARAKALGLDVPTLQQQNNSAEFFRALGQEIVTGPTRTNVNDFRAILIEPEV